VNVAIPVPGQVDVSADLAGDDSSPLLVALAHGAGQGMDSPFMRSFQNGLAGRGFQSARFNFPYMQRGRKVPDPAPVLETCWRAVADFLRDQSGARKLVLGGKSMGGRIASQVVAAGYPADGLLLLGYPLHPPARPERLRDAHLYQIECPMLFLSGTRDGFAERELLEPIVERIGAHAKLRWIEGGDHSFHVRKRADAEIHAEALDTITEWLERL